MGFVQILGHFSFSQIHLLSYARHVGLKPKLGTREYAIQYIPKRAVLLSESGILR